MYIREYGNAHKKDLLFFPGSCEPWQEFAGAAEELAQSFRVLLVVPDGQDPDEHTDFISVEKTVEDTGAWLKTQGIERLEAIYGLSYGGGMATRFLVSQDLPVKKAIIDAGTAPYTYPKWICKLICVRDYFMVTAGRARIGAMKMAFPPERFARNPDNADEEYREIQRLPDRHGQHTRAHRHLQQLARKALRNAGESHLQISRVLLFAHVPYHAADCFPRQCGTGDHAVVET